MRRFKAAEVQDKLEGGLCIMEVNLEVDNTIHQVLIFQNDETLAFLVGNFIEILIGAQCVGRVAQPRSRLLSHGPVGPWIGGVNSCDLGGRAGNVPLLQIVPISDVYSAGKKRLKHVVSIVYQLLFTRQGGHNEAVELHSGFVVNKHSEMPAPEDRVGHLDPIGNRHVQVFVRVHSVSFLHHVKRECVLLHS